MKQSGARSAPGGFWVIYGPKQQKNIGKYRNPAREARRENLGVCGVQKQQNHRESSTVLFNKNAVASEKTLIDSKTLQGCGWQSSQGAFKKNTKIKRGGFADMNHQSPVFIFLHSM